MEDVTQLVGLPAVLDVPTAGRLLGLGRSVAYDLVAAGRWPTPVLRLGRRWRVPTAPLLALLGLGGSDSCSCGGTLAGSPADPDDFPATRGDRS